MRQPVLAPPEPLAELPHQQPLAANRADAYHLVIESSANVNTNPRIEQSTIHRSTDLYAFYAEFFDGIRSIDRRA